MSWREKIAGTLLVAYVMAWLAATVCVFRLWGDIAGVAVFAAFALSYFTVFTSLVDWGSR